MMNGKKQATEKIEQFLKGSEKVLLLTGTYQNEKHELVLAVLAERVQTSILFRANGADKFGMFFQKFGITPKGGGVANRFGHCHLYVDTMNSRSWAKSPDNIGVGIVYPASALKGSEGDECIHDFLRRGAKKIFVVTWTDNKSLDWVEQFEPQRVVYDAEEERPDYHERVIEVIAEAGDPNEGERPRNLPNYVRNCPSNLLVQFFCKGRCSAGRWGQLNKSNPGFTKLKSAPMGEFRLTCLKCGVEATDNYNWYSR